MSVTKGDVQSEAKSLARYFRWVGNLTNKSYLYEAANYLDQLSTNDEECQNIADGCVALEQIYDFLREKLTPNHARAAVTMVATDH